MSIADRLALVGKGRSACENVTSSALEGRHRAQPGVETPGFRYPSARTRTTFVSIAAQADNLGDIEIRKVLLDWLDDSGCPMKVFTGQMPRSYIAAFDLPNHAAIYRSSAAFQRALVSHAIRRRAHLVFAPGPQTLEAIAGTSPKQRVRSLLVMGKPVVNLANTLLVRLSGGHVLSIGRAVRGNHRGALLIERLRARATNAYSVRDTASSGALGIPARVVPDLAFGHGDACPDEPPKSIMVLSFRGDRTVQPQAIHGAVRCARLHGLEPVFVTQVKSDNALHQRLADQTDCRAISWTGETHAEQMRIVQTTYRHAAVVVSDRLHALLFGVQSGAIPVAVIHPGTDKLTSTLDHVLPLVTVRAVDTEWASLDDVLSGGVSRSAVQDAAKVARDDVLQLRAEVLSLLTGPTPARMSTR